MAQLIALILKDLLLHGRALVLFVTGFTLLVWVLVWAAPQTRPLDAGGRALITQPLLLFSFAIWAEWLVNTERSKETFAFLRALPVSDGHVVGSKFMVCWMMECLVLVVVLTVSPMPLSLNAWQTVTYLVAGLTAATVTLAVQLCVSHRKAFAVPTSLLFLVVGAIATVAQSPAGIGRLIALWNEPRAHVVAWLVCGGLNALLVHLTVLRFRSQDTPQLVG